MLAGALGGCPWRYLLVWLSVTALLHVLVMAKDTKKSRRRRSKEASLSSTPLSSTSNGAFLVINLGRRQDRYAKLKKVLSASSKYLWEKHERIDAFDGRTITLHDEDTLAPYVTAGALQEARQKRGLATIEHHKGETMRFNEHLTEGAVGCVISHYRALQAVANHPTARWALILEDDIVELVPQADKAIEALLARLPSDWDAVYLGHHAGNGSLVAGEGRQAGRNVQVGALDKRLPGLYAWIVRKEAARKILKGAFPVELQVDLGISTWILKNGLRGYRLAHDSLLFFALRSERWLDSDIQSFREAPKEEFDTWSNLMEAFDSYIKEHGKMPTGMEHLTSFMKEKGKMQHSLIHDGHVYRAMQNGISVDSYLPDRKSAKCHRNWERLPQGFELAPDTPELRKVLTAHTWSTHVVILDSLKGYTTFQPAGQPFGDSLPKAKRRESNGVVEYMCPWECYQILVRRPIMDSNENRKPSISDANANRKPAISDANANRKPAISDVKASKNKKETAAQSRRLEEARRTKSEEEDEEEDGEETEEGERRGSDRREEKVEPVPAQSEQSGTTFKSFDFSVMQEKEAAMKRCQDYCISTGCDWTEKWSCPWAATPGKEGRAGNDGTLGYRCCCVDRACEFFWDNLIRDEL